MSAYAVPVLEAPTPAAKSEVILIANGDLRQSANQVCWAAQAEVERAVTAAFAAEGLKVRRAHPYRDDLKHGFIFSQRMGMDIFMGIDPEAPIVVVEAVWQYQSPHSRRVDQPPRPHTHGRELVGAMAGSGGHAQPQRLPCQGRCEVQHHLEQGFQGRIFPERLAPVDPRRQD